MSKVIKVIHRSGLTPTDAARLFEDDVNYFTKGKHVYDIQYGFDVNIPFYEHSAMVVYDDGRDDWEDE